MKEIFRMKVREESLKYGTSKKKKLANREEETEAVIAAVENGFLYLMKTMIEWATLMSVNLNGKMNVRKTLNTFSI